MKSTWPPRSFTAVVFAVTIGGSLVVRRMLELEAFWAIAFVSALWGTSVVGWCFGALFWWELRARRRRSMRQLAALASGQTPPSNIQHVTQEQGEQ